MPGYGVGVAATCDTLIGTERCDVAAIGRCFGCGNAFCTSHRMVSSVTQYVDQCARCATAADVARAQHKVHAATGAARVGQITRAANRERLRQAGLATVTVHRGTWRTRKTRFTGREVSSHVLEPVREGWYLSVAHQAGSMFAAGFDQDVVLTADGAAGDNADGIIAVRWQRGVCEIVGLPWNRMTMGRAMSGGPATLDERITTGLIAAVLAKGRCPKSPASDRR